jgi:hypothetical protein
MSNGEVLYVIHDTNQRDMPEVASYTATNIDILPGSAVALFRRGTDVVAVHHLAPGHSVIPIIPDEDDEPHTDAAWTTAGSIKDGVVTETDLR